MATRQYPTVDDDPSTRDRAFDEKRNFIRMKVDTMVTYTYFKKSERYDGKCINLSGAGMLLETDKKLKSGDKLQLTVPTDSEEFSSLNAIVEVIRVHALPDQHKFEVGLVIKQIKS